MASAIPPILVEIKANVDGLKTGMTQAKTALGEIDNKVKQTNTSMGSFVSRMKQVGATLGVAFAGQQIVQFMNQSIAAASDLNESLSKSNVVFGQNAAAIEEWSKSAATNLGMSQQQALEATGTYGNLFQALGVGRDEATKMSTSLVQLAADLASFNNASPEETLLSLRSGLSGQPEALKRFGIAINEVTLKQQALNMGLIKTTSGVLPPAIKAQATYALVMEQTKMAQGDYARTADGVANKQRTLTAQMMDAKAKIGQGLLPMWQTFLNILGKGVIPVLSALGGFLAENKEAMVVFTTALMAGAAAWGVYTLFVKRAIIQEKIMQALQKLNPIGLIVVAVAALAAGFVVLWNRSAKFREIMVEVGKAGLKAISFLINLVGDLVTGMMKVVTGPLRLLLKGLDLLGISGAGNALKAIESGIDSVGNFFDKTAKKVAGYGKELDKLKNKKITFGSTDSGTAAGVPVPDLGGGTTTSLTGGKKKKSDDAAILKLITSTRNKIADAYKQYNEKVADAYEKYNERIADANTKFTEQVTAAQTEFTERVTEITKQRNDDMAALEKEHASRVAEITKTYANKLQDIIRDSMNRLRDAFAQATATNVSKIFGDLEKAGNQSAEGLLSALRDKLTASKRLAENAAKLSAMGFSQTFIEQVVAGGTEEGNKLAEALIGADSQVVKDVQAAFVQMESLTNTGMDALAKTIYDKQGLATDALKQLYASTQVELANALAEEQRVYTEAQAAINAKFNEELGKAEAARDAAIAKAHTDLAQATAEANADLTKALADAAKALNDKLADIERDFMQKLATMKAEAKKTAAEIAAMMAAINQAKTTAAAVPYAPPPTSSATITNPTVGSQLAEFRKADAAASAGKTAAPVSVVVNAQTNASATTIAREAVLALTYGRPLTTVQATQLMRAL